MTKTTGKIAIVLGATGLIGQALVQQLSQAKHISKVIAISRSPITYHQANVENIVVNFENLSEYARCFNGDMLFSCLGTTVKSAGSIAAQKKVDVDYQFKVAQLAAENGVQHYLLVSSSGANSASKSAYFNMKGLLEDKIAQLGFTRVSIFRPSLLVGTRKEFRLAEKVSAPLLSLLSCLPGIKKYKPISGEQVAAKMVSVSRHSNGAYELYELNELFIL